MVNWISLVIPFAYLSVLVGSLATFSSLYRRRKAARSAALAPWFPPHIQRNVYLSLLHMDSEPGQPTVPDTVLKTALLRRAAEDIHRIITVRNAKQALSTLLQRGNVGDDLWQRFLRAEKEMEAELRDVITEANAFAPNWGQTIFQSANEMVNNQAIQNKISELQQQTEAEKAWWEKRRAGIQSSLLEELDMETTRNVPVSTIPKTSDDEAVIVEPGGPGGQQGAGKKKKGKK